MKKTLITAALIASLSTVAIACDNDEATPEPTTPAEAVESMEAEVEATVEAEESMAAEEVEDAEETMEAAAEDAEATVEAAVEEETTDE